MPLETRSAIVAAAFEAKFPEYARAPVSGIRHAIPSDTPQQRTG